MNLTASILNQNWFRVASALVACCAVFCFSAGKAKAEDELVLQLKWYHQFQFAGYYAADIKGFFQEEGLRVEIQEGNPERPPLRTVLEGKADFGVTDCDVLLSRMRGNPVVACATVFQHSPYIFLTLADSGIRTPSDFVGKNIMVSGDQGSAQLLAMMRREGLPIDDLRMHTHTWDVRDLISGKVDVVSAYATAEPSQVKALGAEPFVIRASDYGVDFYGDTLFTTEEVSKQKKETVNAMIKASTRGWNYAMQHPDEIIDYILTLPGVEERGIQRENLEFEAAEMRELILPDVVEVGHMNEGRWRKIADTFVETGVAYEPLNADWFDGFVYSEQNVVPAQYLRQVALVVFAITFVSLLVIAWNVILKKRVEDKTREVHLERLKLNSILDHSLSIQFLLSGDGKLIEVNRTALEFGQCARKETLGMPFLKTPWWQSAPEVAQLIESGIENIVSGEEDLRFEFTLADAKGESHDLEFSMRPVFDVTGNIEFIVAEGIDITLQKKNAEALRQAAELRRLILDSALDSVIGVDRENRIVEWNAKAAETFGVSEGEAEGSEVSRFLPELLHRLAECGDSALGSRFEMEAVREDGTTFPTELAVSVIPDDSHIYLNIFLRNIEETKRLEETLRQSQKMQAIGQLAGGVAHDFNNLLTVIQGNASLIEMEADVDSPNRQQVMEILSASERASGLTKQLLAFSRQQPLSPKELDLHEIISSVFAMLKRLIGEDILLDLNFGEEPMRAHADPVMLEQILLNLAVNGRDAMPQGGTLSVRTSKEEFEAGESELPDHHQGGSYVRIDIRDTGTGIAEENLPHIFEPFFSTKDVGKGTGLGLSTVFGVVEQHGGWVTVDSRLDSGTTFSVWLPSATGNKIVSNARDGRKGRVVPSGNETILLVEDETMVRLVALKILTKHGYNVIEAASGKEALEIWEKRGDEIDLLLTDIVMPHGISGHDLAESLKKDRPDLKIIYSSGYTAEIFRGDAVFPQNAVFLGKPYELEDLLKTVRTSLGDEIALPS